MASSPKAETTDYRLGYVAGYNAGTRRLKKVRLANKTEHDELFYRAVKALQRTLNDLDPDREYQLGQGEFAMLKEYFMPTAHEVHRRLKKGNTVKLYSAYGRLAGTGVLVRQVAYCEDGPNQIWQVLTPNGLEELEVSHRDVIRKDENDGCTL